MREAADRIRDALSDVVKRHGALKGPTQKRTRTGNWHQTHQLVAVMAGDVVKVADAIMAATRPPARPAQVVVELRMGSDNAYQDPRFRENGEPVLILSTQAQFLLDQFDLLHPPPVQAPAPAPEAGPAAVEERAAPAEAAHERPAA